MIFSAPQGVKVPVVVSAFPDELYQCSPELGRESISQHDLLQET